MWGHSRSDHQERLVGGFRFCYALFFLVSLLGEMSVRPLCAFNRSTAGFMEMLRVNIVLNGKRPCGTIGRGCVHNAPMSYLYGPQGLGVDTGKWSFIPRKKRELLIGRSCVVYSVFFYGSISNSILKQVRGYKKEDNTGRMIMMQNTFWKSKVI